WHMMIYNYNFDIRRLYMRKSCAGNRQDIINKIRKLWSQHVYWTRFFIISTAEELQDLKYVTDRLLENPGDFAKVLRMLYGDKKANEFKKLLTEHLQIAGELVNADKDKNTVKADGLRKKWYANADDIAEFLSVINPYWSRQKWHDMMYSHLNMTEKEAGFRLQKEYPKDIEMFESIEKEALEMGDYMASGIMRQFCCN
ncbi:MAG: acetylglutamate kinase, partial [Oscillospiraceae bacterium]